MSASLRQEDRRLVVRVVADELRTAAGEVFREGDLVGLPVLEAERLLAAELVEREDAR